MLDVNVVPVAGRHWRRDNNPGQLGVRQVSGAQEFDAKKNPHTSSTRAIVAKASAGSCVRV